MFEGRSVEAIPRHREPGSTVVNYFGFDFSFNLVMALLSCVLIFCRFSMSADAISY
jgi:hypothetical protein